VNWTSLNIGASRPEDYGDYYAWGDTKPYYIQQNPDIWNEGKESGYNRSTYKWYIGPPYRLTKYNDDEEDGFEGYSDGKTVLDLEDDAAYVNLGGKWRLPTIREWCELLNTCSWTWKKVNGINGIMVTSKINGNSIFLPAAGDRWTKEHGVYSRDTGVRGAGLYGYYWSSKLPTLEPQYAWLINFGSDGVKEICDYRCAGLPIRPVSVY